MCKMHDYGSTMGARSKSRRRVGSRGGEGMEGRSVLELKIRRKMVLFIKVSYEDFHHASTLQFNYNIISSTHLKLLTIIILLRLNEIITHRLKTIRLRAACCCVCLSLKGGRIGG